MSPSGPIATEAARVKQCQRRSVDLAQMPMGFLTPFGTDVIAEI
jgi:hypothetical protein